MLGYLVEQELALNSNQLRICVGGRPEFGEWIVTAAERCPQPRDVELLGQEVAAQAIALGPVCRWIEFDQDVTGLDRHPVLHLDRAHDPRLEWLDDLDPASRQDPTARRCDDINRAPPGPG